jgi:hypothetical protein
MHPTPMQVDNPEMTLTARLTGAPDMIMRDQYGRPFHPNLIRATWRPQDGLPGFVLSSMCVTGKTIRKDGTRGTSERFALYTPDGWHGFSNDQAPAWLRLYVDALRPQIWPGTYVSV